MFNLVGNLNKIVRLSAVNRTIIRTFKKRQPLIKHFARNTQGNFAYNPSRSLMRLYCTKNDEQTEESINRDFEEITGGNEELLHKLKVIRLEMEVLRQEGKCVPDAKEMKSQHWRELLKLATRSARTRYLEFLFKIEKKKENQKEKKEQKKIQRENSLKERKPVETFEEFVTTYDLGHNNIFLRFYDTTINQFYNNNLIQAMQFGQKIVVDCGYVDQMTSRENRNCAKQLMFLFSENRIHADPYDLHLCNANQDSELMHSLHKHIATMYEPWFPLNMHQASYIDLFPREQLVYLTPHCREEMLEYDHNAIYIIGGIVDKVNNQPLSLAKAKKEGIKMLKLPLDRYLQWGAGSGKSLTLNQMISILLDIKTTGDWKHALRHVPRRKLLDEEDQESVNPIEGKAAYNLKKKWFSQEKREGNRPTGSRFRVKQIFND